MARREQFNAAKEAFPSLELTCSVGYTRISIFFEHFAFHLTYDIDRRFPSTVDQSITESMSSFPQESRERMNFILKHQSDFQKRDLLSVLSDLVVCCVCKKQKNPHLPLHPLHLLFQLFPCTRRCPVHPAFQPRPHCSIHLHRSLRSYR